MKRKVLAGFALMLAGNVLAGNLNYFEILQDGGELGTAGITWDLLQAGHIRPAYVDTVRLSGGSKEALAQSLAEKINGKVGATVAEADGARVYIDQSFTQISYNAEGSSGGYFKLGQLITSSADAGRFSIDPDLFTGSTSLVGLGTFSVTGPGSLNASFTAPDGTLADHLLALFAAPMIAAGYQTLMDSKGISFFAPTSGEISFVFDGPGFDYGLGRTEVPEPSVTVLCGCGLFLVGAIRLKKSQSLD